MPQIPIDPSSSDIPEAIAAPKGRWSFSLVWLIPLVAVVVGGWLAVKAVLDRGPVITISFKTAEGLEAGKTKIKYKNVDVGQVTQIKVSGDLQGVVATAEMVKNAEPHMVEDTRFWVVRPRVAGGQVSGLGTLFSGAYIGVDIGKSDQPRSEFIGLDNAPIVTGDVPGRQFILLSKTQGSLGVGSPVYYRQVEVGSVVANDLNQDGKAVTLKIFVNKPYDQYVTPQTRFWNASGIDISMDASGIRVDTQSLTSILIGGVAFEAPADAVPTSPAEENTKFGLAESRTEAMKNPDLLSVPVTMYFKDSLRGLSIGSPVEFKGISIGEVQSMNVEYDEGQSEFRFPVGITLYPGRLLKLVKSGGEEYQMDQATRRARWDVLTAHGLRGQLRTGNLLTGQVYIALDFFPDALKDRVDWTKTPPVLPVVQGSMTALQETLSHLARKLEKVPLDQIGADLRQSLATLNRTLESADKFVKHLDADVTPAAKTALEEARRTLGTAERTLNAEAPMQQDVRGALRDLSRAAQAIRALADSLERHPEALLRGKKEQKP